MIHANCEFSTQFKDGNYSFVVFFSSQIKKRMMQYLPEKKKLKFICLVSFPY